MYIHTWLIMRRRCTGTRRGMTGVIFWFLKVFRIFFLFNFEQRPDYKLRVTSHFPFRACITFLASITLTAEKTPEYLTKQHMSAYTCPRQLSRVHTATYIINNLWKHVVKISFHFIFFCINTWYISFTARQLSTYHLNTFIF